MIRYYLIPFETDEKLIQGCDICPKYLADLGKCAGLLPKIVSMTGSIVTQWLRDYYLICIERGTADEYAVIESHGDVIRIDATTNLSALSALGVNITGISSVADIERAVTKWLIDDEKDFDRIISPPTAAIGAG